MAARARSPCWRPAGCRSPPWRPPARKRPARLASRSIPPRRPSPPRPPRRAPRASRSASSAVERAPWAASATRRSLRWAARGFAAPGHASSLRSRGTDARRPSRPRLRRTRGWRVRPLRARARHPSARKFPVSCPAPVYYRPPSREGRSLKGLQPRTSLLPAFVFARSELRPQLLRHGFAGPEYSRPDSPDRAIHDLRDLLVREAVQLPQRDRGTQLLGQRRDRIVHRLRDLLGCELAFGCIDVAQPRRILETLSLLAVELGRRGRPAPKRDEVVLGCIDADPVQPRVERAVAAEVRQRPVCLDERFLGDVLDLRRIADHPR